MGNELREGNQPCKQCGVAVVTTRKFFNLSQERRYFCIIKTEIMHKVVATAYFKKFVFHEEECDWLAGTLKIPLQFSRTMYRTKVPRNDDVFVVLSSSCCIYNRFIVNNISLYFKADRKFL